MPFLPSSHRARVRLLRRTIVGATVLAIGLLVAFDRNAGHSSATPHIDRPAYVPPVAKTVRASAEAKREAVRNLAVFTQSAIIRRNLDASWPLADAHMKDGVSHADWLAGNLPVPPYDAAAFSSAGYTLQYSHPGVLGYDVLILPKQTKAGELSGQQVYSCELHHLRDSWLVDFCYPRTTL